MFTVSFQESATLHAHQNRIVKRIAANNEEFIFPREFNVISNMIHGIAPYITVPYKVPLTTIKLPK